MTFLSRIVSTCVACAYVTAQTTPVSVPAAARSIDTEATQVLSAAQAQLKMLPAAQKARISGTLNDQARRLSLSNNTFTFDELILPDPHNLTLIEKNNLLSNIQRTQQLVDPSLVIRPAADLNADAIILTFQSSSPLTGPEIQNVRQALKRLPVVAKSIGRLLWANPADGNWHFEGTVFVSKTNVVATACHVVSDLTDVSNGQSVLRKDRVAVIDFSEIPLPRTGPLPASLHTYPVVKVLATGSTAGCDVATLQISGADSIPPLTLASGSFIPKRMLVLGYPQLADLTPLVCQYEMDPTATYFCQFHADNPSAAKVASPGKLYTSNSHDGISVFTYGANTRGGQSGSPVLDLETLQVVGVHYCCTGVDLPNALACATWHPQNLKWNEAIASATITSDQTLRLYFSPH